MKKQTKIILLVVISCTLLLAIAIPSFAANESSEGGQFAAPTDLTGTSWSIPTGWTASSGYGQFSVDGTYVENDFTYNIVGIRVGYMTPSSPSANALCIMTLSGSYRNVYSDSDFILNISGGADVINPSLISWLMANATWINPPEPEPTIYTIQPNYYQIKLQPDMIPDDVGFYEYGGQFIYENETYRSLRFARVSGILTNVYLYDDYGNQVVIKGQTASNDGWFSGRNITLVSPITTENEEAYTYFTENLSATEQSPFDLVTYMISGFFKALDNFFIFFDFSLLDFIFVMCGLLGAIWFLKLLAGG